MSKTYKKNTKTYKHKDNAVCFTIYSLKGETIPTKAKEEIEELTSMLAIKHGLVVNVATT